MSRTPIDHRALLRELLKLSTADELASAWRVHRSAVYRWLDGTREIPGPVQLLIEARAVRDGVADEQDFPLGIG